METKREKVSNKKYRAAVRPCARNPPWPALPAADCLAPPESHCPPCLAQLASWPAGPHFCECESLEPTQRVERIQGRRPAAAAAAPGGSVKTRQHEQRASVRELCLHVLCRRARACTRIQLIPTVLRCKSTSFES
jgi:hypothetical protein